MRGPSTIHTGNSTILMSRKLVTRVLNGDADAFNPLVRKYQQKIYNLIYRQVHDRETAKDLCQEVFLKAWQALPKFKGQSVFYTWLYKIAVNCSIDFLRKHKQANYFRVRSITRKRGRGPSDDPDAAVALSNP